MSFQKPTRAPKALARKVKRRRPLGWRRCEAKAASDVTDEQREAIWRAYGGLCAYRCFRVASEWDHVLAIAHGGKDTASNIVPCCKFHNQMKGTARTWEDRLCMVRHPYRAYPINRKDTP